MLDEKQLTQTAMRLIDGRLNHLATRRMPPETAASPASAFEAAKTAAKAAADDHRRESGGHELWMGSVSWLCDDCDAIYPTTVRTN